MIRTIFFTVSFLTTICLYGQEDSIVHLPEIEVKGDLVKWSTVGQLHYELDDSIALSSSQSLADLLNNDPSCFIKSYGPGSIGTVSIRGGSASHTVMLWNGLVIGSPMVGQLDLNLVQPSTGSVTLSRTSNSSAWGSGAIGGTVSISSPVHWDKGWQWNVAAGLGSFNQNSGLAVLGWSDNRLSISSSIDVKRSNGDFRVDRPAAFSEDRLPHAKFHTVTSMHKLGYRIDETQSIECSFWTVDADRELPPTLHQFRSLASQSDEIRRLFLKYRRNTRRGISEVRAGQFFERIHYTDPEIAIDVPSSFATSTIDLLHSIAWAGGNLLMNFNSRLTQADISHYSQLRTEWNNALFVRYQRTFGNLKAEMGVRQPMLDDQWIAPVPHMAFDYAFDKVSLLARVARNFRFPSMNDRFWQPGGNEDLKSEEGWTTEIGLRYKDWVGPVQFEQEVTLFNRNIDNWILWAPIDHNTYWSATNLGEVWSRGIDLSASLAIGTDKKRLVLDLGASLLSSTNQTAVRLPRIEKGEQIYYSPQRKYNIALTGSLSRFDIRYAHRFISEVRGINKDLPSYDVADVLIKYEYEMDRMQAALSFGINNVWNTIYETVEFRPMPGRWFELALNIKKKQ